MQSANTQNPIQYKIWSDLNFTSVQLDSHYVFLWKVLCNCEQKICVIGFEKNGPLCCHDHFDVLIQSTVNALSVALCCAPIAPSVPRYACLKPFIQGTINGKLATRPNISCCIVCPWTATVTRTVPSAHHNVNIRASPCYGHASTRKYTVLLLRRNLWTTAVKQSITEWLSTWQSIIQLP